MSECAHQVQSIMFAVVNSHHTNGISENIIRLLSKLSIAMMIRAKKIWTSTISAHLWIYAITMATKSLNEIPSLQYIIQITPNQNISGSKIIQNSKHWNPFLCPVYVLAGPSQTGRNIFHHCKERSNAITIAYKKCVVGT